MPYIGKGANGFGIRERYRYSASGGQTDFTSTDLDSKTLQIDSGSLVDVYLNGVLLDTADYNTNTANQVTLTSGATASDEVMIVVYDVFSLSDSMPKTGGTFSGNVNVSSTDAGSSADPTLTLYRNSASPADADFGGEITFKGKNDASQDVEYARIVSKMTDVSDGTEDGNVEFHVISNGSESSRILLKGNGSTAFKNADVSIDDSKSLTIADGNLVIGTSGHGIDFSATGNSSGTMTSELFDDYEEGTWTPDWNSGFSAIAYAQQFGRYVKTGSKVFAQFWILTHASSTVMTNGNSAIMGGLPFTIGAVSDSQDEFARGAGNVGFQNHNSNIPSPYGENGGTRIYFYKDGSSFWIHAGSGNAHNSKYFIGGFTYTVDM